MRHAPGEAALGLPRVDERGWLLFAGHSLMINYDDDLICLSLLSGGRNEADTTVRGRRAGNIRIRLSLSTDGRSAGRPVSSVEIASRHVVWRATREARPSTFDLNLDLDLLVLVLVDCRHEP